MTKLLGSVFCLALALPFAAHAAAPDPALVAKCESCHGLHGDSKAGGVPRLNGQQTAYLQSRLKEFQNPTRGTPSATNHMWETASNLKDQTAADLAAYFAQQAPTAAAAGGALAAKGAKLYREGAGANVPACQSCHGASAEGRGAVPRLAGQHGEYLDLQLGALMLQVRVNETMNHPALHLKSDQIKALTAYLAAQ
jgi:cytochrome c553